MDLRALLAQFTCTLPDFQQPPQLLLAGAAIVSFRHRLRNVVSLPCLTQQRLRPGSAFVKRARGEHIGINVLPIGTVGLRRIGSNVVVEESFAAQVMINADDVWCTSVLQKPFELT